jgi:hypothetical protein
LNIFGWVAPLLGRMGLLRCPEGNRDGFLACLSLYIPDQGGHSFHSIPAAMAFYTEPRFTREEE